MPVPQTNHRYSYQEYITWGEDERWEIIAGEPYNRAPAPNLAHQNSTGRLYAFLLQKLKGKPCQSFIAPTDVIFSDHDIVQPDVFVVCDPKKLANEKNVQGAPDLIFEVLSPSTEGKDRREKKELYAKYGVKEYIVVNPASQFAEQFILQDDGEYDKGKIVDANQTVILHSVETCSIPLSEIFAVDMNQSE